MDLYADIPHCGVILPTGEVNPSVEAYRKNANQQLWFFSTLIEWRLASLPGAVSPLARL